MNTPPNLNGDLNDSHFSNEVARKNTYLEATDPVSDSGEARIAAAYPERSILWSRSPDVLEAQSRNRTPQSAIHDSGPVLSNNNLPLARQIAGADPAKFRSYNVSQAASAQINYVLQPSELVWVNTIDTQYSHRPQTLDCRTPNAFGEHHSPSIYNFYAQPSTLYHPRRYTNRQSVHQDPAGQERRLHHLDGTIRRSLLHNQHHGNNLRTLYRRSPPQVLRVHHSSQQAMNRYPMRSNRIMNPSRQRLVAIQNTPPATQPERMLGNLHPRPVSTKYANTLHDQLSFARVPGTTSIRSGSTSSEDIPLRLLTKRSSTRPGQVGSHPGEDMAGDDIGLSQSVRITRARGAPSPIQHSDIMDLVSLLSSDDEDAPSLVEPPDSEPLAVDDHKLGVPQSSNVIDLGSPSLSEDDSVSSPVQTPESEPIVLSTKLSRIRRIVHGMSAPYSWVCSKRLLKWYCFREKRNTIAK
jgi:hypothetical protein